MTMARGATKPATGVTFALLVALFVALSCTGLSEEELTCEQAVSKISDCCPGVDTRRLPCVDTAGGCASGEAEATVSREAGSCVLDLSCEVLRSSGKCDRIVSYALLPHVQKDRRALEAEVCR
jgi:hypothetical protein